MLMFLGEVGSRLIRYIIKIGWRTAFGMHILGYGSYNFIIKEPSGIYFVKYNSWYNHRVLRRCVYAYWNVTK